MTQIPARPVVSPGGLRPLRSRYILVVLLPLVALASFVVVGLFSSGSMDEMSKSWARADVPGQVVLETHPGTWYVYQDATLNTPTIRVLAPDGSPVAVQTASSGDLFMVGGSAGSLVAKFDVPEGSVGEKYTVVADTTAAQGSFAVTDLDLAGWQLTQFIAALVLLAVNVGAAIAIAVVPVVRWRRAVRAAGDAATAA